MKSKNIVEILVLLILFIFGIQFRMWFISLAPQLYGYDQYEYDMYAKKMMDRPLLLASHSYRSYPFPLMLAIYYSFVGFANTKAVYGLHAVIDSLTGILVYFILKRGFHTPKASWIGTILYMINPFTSGYVGVVLSEVLSAFFITATIASGLKFIEKKNILWGILFGFCAGMSAETRNAAFAWAIFPVGLTIFAVSLKKYWKAYVGIIIGVCITISYPLYVNWRDWKEINISTVDSMFAREFFNGAILKILPPFNYVYPRDVQLMYGEYYAEYAPWRSYAERQAIYNKYWQKGWDIVKADPLDYIKYRFIKAIYVWQKENIFFYDEPGFNDHKQYTFALNVILEIFTLFGLWGIGRYIWKHSITKKEWFSETLVRLGTPKGYVWGCVVGSIFYGTVFFAISHAEYRLTIPFYPLLILMATIGGFWIYGVVKKGLYSQE
jgi:hypothetical protein